MATVPPHIFCAFWGDCSLGALTLQCVWLRSVGSLPVPWNAHGGIVDLRMTDVPDLVRVDVVTPIGNSDHSNLSKNKR